MDDVNLSGLFVHARLIAWNDQGVELGFARGTFAAERSKDAVNVTKLKAILATLTGQAFDVKVKEIAHMPAPSGAPPGPGGASAAAGSQTNGHAGAHVAAPGEPPPSATVAELEHERRRAERERRESEARQHPLTKAAIDTFGATIKEIKVDG
jgi:hypothetical protein